MKKNLGIFMDHYEAHLIDLSSSEKCHNFTSAFTPSTKAVSLQKGEKKMHHKEQQLQKAYYQSIAEKISKYDHVLIFGPTDAKLELHNYIKDSFPHLDAQIDLQNSEHLTDNQQKAVVIKHFNTQDV